MALSSPRWVRQKKKESRGFPSGPPSREQLKVRLGASSAMQMLSSKSEPRGCLAREAQVHSRYLVLTFRGRRGAAFWDFTLPEDHPKLEGDLGAP